MLADLPLYDIVVVDAPDGNDEQQQDEVLLAVNTRRSGEAPTLPALPQITFLFDGHDDCYFYAETRDTEVPERLLARLLSLLAGSSVIGERDSVEIREAPTTLAAGLLDESPRWVGWPVSLRDREFELGLRPQAWQPPTPIPTEPATSVVYNLDTGLWSRAE